MHVADARAEGYRLQDCLTAEPLVGELTDLLVGARRPHGSLLLHRQSLHKHLHQALFAWSCGCSQIDLPARERNDAYRLPVDANLRTRINIVQLQQDARAIPLLRNGDAAAIPRPMRNGKELPDALRHISRRGIFLFPAKA